MEKYYVRDAVADTGGKLLCGSEEVELVNCATNSSQSKDRMFIPIIGERVDGHRYIESAFENGAVASISSNEEAALQVIDRWKLGGQAAKPIILVEDTLRALQQMAHSYELRLALPKVGVTGSVGKTTTKEMIACALSGGLKVFKTAGNANSQIGVPLTLMSISRSDEAAVIEMGMSQKGEMERLARLLSIDAAVITNIGVSHIEQLGTQENILREKWHITDALPEDGVVFLNGDDPILMKKAAQERELHGRRIVTFGLGEGCDYRAENITASGGRIHFDAVYDGQRLPIVLNVLGEHNVRNALAAAAVAGLFGVDAHAAADALSKYSGVAMRQQITVKDGITYIDDSYNASPDSMKAGLNVLSQTDAVRRIAVLADMLELGDETAAYHRQVGEYAAQLGIDVLLLYGELAKNIGIGAGDGSVQIHHFMDKDELVRFLDNMKMPGDAVLFKGSRGMKLNEAADYFIKQD